MGVAGEMREDEKKTTDGEEQATRRGTETAHGLNETEVKIRPESLRSPQKRRRIVRRLRRMNVKKIRRSLTTRKTVKPAVTNTIRARTNLLAARVTKTNTSHRATVYHNQPSAMKVTHRKPKALLKNLILRKNPKSGWSPLKRKSPQVLIPSENTKFVEVWTATKGLWTSTNPFTTGLTTVTTNP